MSDKTSTRQELIAAAQQLVVDGGWEIVTTRRVAERAGVSPGLVHYHVGSIEGLRRAAACEGARSLLEGPFREALEAPNLREGLLAFLLRLDLKPDYPGVVLLNEALVAATHDAELRSDLATVSSAFRTHLTERLAAQGTRRQGMRRSGHSSRSPPLMGFCCKERSTPASARNSSSGGWFPSWNRSKPLMLPAACRR